MMSLNYAGVFPPYAKRALLIARASSRLPFVGQEQVKNGAKMLRGGVHARA